MSQKYDANGRRIVTLPFSGITESLNDLVDPDEDSVLIWDDSEDAFVLTSVADFSQSLQGIFAGFVTGNGATAKLPAGWSLNSAGSGSVDIQHDLGLNAANELSVVAMVLSDASISARVNVTSHDANSFTIVTFVSSTGSASAADVFFIAMLNTEQ